MSDDTPDSLIPYDAIVQEALRAVVGRVLGEIVDAGSELPGAHHFYITFKTHAPGVSVPASLRERFPDEMTIVLQNKFWDLRVEEELFSVGLSFNQNNCLCSILIDYELIIKYSSINFLKCQDLSCWIILPYGASCIIRICNLLIDNLSLLKVTDTIISEVERTPNRRHNLRF